MKFLILFALFALASAGAPNEVPILRQTSDIEVDGSYKYSYETGDGVVAEQAGDATAVHGSFKYTSPEGTPVEIKYVADENGYQPTGDSIPVGPPIPEAIVRALEYIRTHPPKDEKH